jgi:DNA invertase Pin-like site-specific DNA recombinase
MATALVEAPFRAAIYTRISSDDDARIKGLGVARQEKACRALIEANGWTVAGVYTDNNASASKEKTNRPQFERLMADIRAGQVDRLVVLGQDRLVRKPDELEGVLRALRSRAISEIDTVTDGRVNIGSLAGRTMARVKGAFDIYYAEYISEKVKDKKDELAQRGLPAGGGTRPFGYEADRITVREEEAELIRDAAKRVLHGETLASVCRDWEARGVKTVTGARWLPNVLRGLLAAPRITGLRAHRGELVGKAAWNPILDRDTYERLQAIFTSRSDRETRGGRTRALLTGLAVCGRDHCGAHLSSGSVNGNRAYICRSGVGFDGCGRLNVKAEPVEALVIEAVLLALDSPRLDRAVAKSPKDDVGDAIAQVEGRVADLAQLWAAGEITKAEWLAARSGLDSQLAQLRARVQRQATLSAAGPYLASPGLLRRSWGKLDLESRRQVLAAVLSSVVIKPASVRGRHKFDPSRVDLVWRV